MNRRYTFQNSVLILRKNFDSVNHIKNQIIFLFMLGSFVLLSLSSKAQDPTFTQFYQNPIYYNPALAGISDGLVIRTNYRNFWRKMNSGFNIADVTIDSEEPFLNGGLGFIAMNGIEGNGIIVSQLIGLAYSYNLPIVPRRIELQMGLQGAYAHKSIRTENLVFSDQLDAIYGITGTSNYSSAQGDGISYPDFATGFNFRFNAGKIRGGTAATTILTGIALHHITQPNESLSGQKSKLPIKYVGYSSAIIKIENIYSKKTFLMPGLIYEKQANFENLMAGVNVKIAPVIFGLWYRKNGLISEPASIQAIALSAGIELGKMGSSTIRIHYSYDINISTYQNLMGDAHEISFSLTLPDSRLFNDRNYGGRNIRACYNKF